MLTRWGMKPTAAADGPAALAEMERAVAAGEPFALVLSDAQMPGMDGFTLAEQIRRRPEMTRATLLMLSSADRQRDAARCRELGISAYLIKPLKKSELLEAITTALGAPSAHRTKPAAAAPRARGRGRRSVRRGSCASCWRRTTRPTSCWPPPCCGSRAMKW